MKTVRELIALAGLVFTVAVVADFYSRLPERIATHFNGAGVANGLGARSTLWVLVGIAVLLYATLSAINWVPRMVSLKRPLAPEQEKMTAKRMGAKTLTLQSSHVAMLAKPAEVSDFIADAAASGSNKTQAAK